MWEILADFIADMFSEFIKGKARKRPENRAPRTKGRQPISPVFASDRTARAKLDAPARQRPTQGSGSDAWHPDAVTTADASWHPDAVIKGDDPWHPDAGSKSNDPWHPDSGAKKNDPWHPGA